MSEIVEAITPRQVESVRSLFRDYRTELPLNLCFEGFEDELRTLPGPYSRPDGRLLLATVAGQPVGCVALRPFPVEKTCEIKHLFVRAPFRTGKLGRALLDRLFEEARQLPYERMRLDTHPATMAAAVRLYRSLGFREVAAEPLQPVPGLLYLELQLAPR